MRPRASEPAPAPARDASPEPLSAVEIERDLDDASGTPAQTGEGVCHDEILEDAQRRLDADTPAQSGEGVLRARGGSRSGWLIGIVLGVLVGLIAFPRVRHTLEAQLQLAMAEDSVPWVRAQDARHSVRELPRLDAVAAAAPDDYLLQVGRATAMSDLATNSRPDSADLPAEVEHNDNDYTLVRLGAIVRTFPAEPGAYAHLVRYMMANRVRILRIELTSKGEQGIGDGEKGKAGTASGTGHGGTGRGEGETPPLRSIPARHSDVRLMLWALHRGEQRDRDNAFWPAMMATTYFAALRDDEGLQALARAARKPRWDAYLYQEILGKWRLYSVAYGDNGALQQIGPLSLVAFPHLRELRAMAQLARWHAERLARTGHVDDAIRIRRNIAWLGRILQEKTRWAYETLYGIELFFIASTDRASNLTPSSIINEGQWEQQASGYLGLLQRTHHTIDIAWLREEATTSCALRERVDLARNDISYPGIAPGIPLAMLFGTWMAGIRLLQQMLAMVTAALLTLSWERCAAGRRAPSLIHVLGRVLLLIGTMAAGILLFTGIPTLRLATLFLSGLTCLVALALIDMRRFWMRRRSGKIPRQAMVAAPKPDWSSGRAAVEAHWTTGTTLRMLGLLLLPMLTALYLLLPALGRLHPVAIMLGSVMGITHPPNPDQMLKIALQGTALPLALVLATVLWAFYRRVSPRIAVFVGMRRLTLPVITCLAITYLLLLNLSLRLDVGASHAINEAAENDLQWILTHSETDSGGG